MAKVPPLALAYIFSATLVGKECLFQQQSECWSSLTLPGQRTYSSTKHCDCGWPSLGHTTIWKQNRGEVIPTWTKRKEWKMDGSQRTSWYQGREKEWCIGKNKFLQRLGAPLLVNPTFKHLWVINRPPPSNTSIWTQGSLILKCCCKPTHHPVSLKGREMTLHIRPPTALTALETPQRPCLPPRRQWVLSH